MFYIYMLRSQRDGSFYIGFTTDLERRLYEHNQGLSRYTKSKIPWIMVYTEKFEEKRDALKRELFLKIQRNKSFYLKLIGE